MEFKTIIEMRENNSSTCKYTTFVIKHSGRLVASVDRRDGRYYIYVGERYANLEGSRTRKASAIRFAQECILSFIEDAEFVQG